MPLLAFPLGVRAAPGRRLRARPPAASAFGLFGGLFSPRLRAGGGNVGPEGTQPRGELGGGGRPGPVGVVWQGPWAGPRRVSRLALPSGGGGGAGELPAALLQPFSPTTGAV